jgi:hypothetical protein
VGGWLTVDWLPGLIGRAQILRIAARFDVAGRMRSLSICRRPSLWFSWLFAPAAPVLRRLGRCVETVHLVENIAEAQSAFARQPPGNRPASGGAGRDASSSTSATGLSFGFICSGRSESVPAVLGRGGAMAHQSRPHASSALGVGDRQGTLVPRNCYSYPGGGALMFFEPRRFPPPWTVEDNGACLIVRNANPQGALRRAVVVASSSRLLTLAS